MVSSIPVTRWVAFLWVWVWVPVRGSLSLFWRETLTKGLRARFLTRTEEDEGRQGHRTDRGSQQNRAEPERGVDRSGGKPTVRERRLLEPRER